MHDDRALIYKRTTLVEEMPLKDTEFQNKRVKTVIDETSWIGDRPQKPSALPQPPPQANTRAAGNTQSWITDNPLYAPTDYDSDYNNPLYVKMNETKMEEVQHSSQRDLRAQTTAAAEPHREVDTLF